MRRIQYAIGIAALALSAAAVGFAQAPAGAGGAGAAGQPGGQGGGGRAGGGAPPPPVPAVLQNYAPVTDARLKNPEEGNWLMIRRTYDGWGYSPLKQITAANVGRLRPVWGFATGETRAHEAPVLVNNGVMFTSTPNNQVIALDAKTGNLLWRYRRQRATGAIVLHDTNRGVALYGDKVYYLLGEAILVALDAKTGREVWTTTVADNKLGYYTSLAPLVGGGGVMVGASGGELGVRGFIASFDLETGKERWRTYTVPAPGEPGSETWPQGGEQWKTGGAPVWITGNYDQATNTAYWGTGNGGPWMGDQRPGDNLYVASTVAIDAATGKIKGHFQYLPNETWDYDEVSPPIVVDFKRGGRQVKGLINVARSGYMWFLDRGDGGKISYVDGKPYVLHNVIRSVDPKTGRPDIDPARRPGTGKEASFCPSFSGGKNWPPVSFSPDTRMIYIPANNGLCSSMTGQPVTYSAGRGYSGVRIGPTVFDPRGNPNVGEIQAWDVDTGQKVWTSSPVKSVNWGGMLATAGGLVFNGGTADRKIRAYDAKSGKVLWEHVLDSAPIAPPTTYMLDGKQYVALNVGWGGDAVSVQRSLANAFPGQTPVEVPQGGSIWVFAVE
jgi:alcohol dehydrogenase (cytochrome c)